jgi:GNAT superfamily N-acetyltransferase
MTGGAGSGSLVARRAQPADAPALVRLRAVMFAAMGTPPGDADAAWRSLAEAWFAERLARPAGFAAFVVEDPALGPVSAAAGICDARPPGPRGTSGTRGHVFNTVTDPRFRGRGHARACLVALLGWFSRETPAEIVELAATRDGIPLYASLGFEARDSPTMRLALRPDRPGSSGS